MQDFKKPRVNRKEQKKIREQKLATKIIELFHKNMSAAAIAKLLMIKKSKAEYRIAKYLETNTDEVQKRGPKPKFSQEHVDFVIELVKKFNGKVQLLDIKLAFEDNFKHEGITISMPTIGNLLLHNGIVFRRLTVPKMTNTPEQI
jgi:transposase